MDSQVNRGKNPVPTQTPAERSAAIKLALENDLRDAPVMAKIALQKIADRHAERVAVGSAGRVGRQQGTVSELTVMADLKPGGAQHLRRILNLIGGNMDGASEVGTVHDMRFVIYDNDKKILFCTAYDGDWDTYIDDFATKIPEYMDLLFANVEGWPGIHDPSVKDFIASHQLTAEGWYVSSPNLSVVQTWELDKKNKALESFIDTYSQKFNKPAAEMTEQELHDSQAAVQQFLKQVGTTGSGVA
ncbi:hypothetical protein Dxin01_02462 [Deinococcus xinjiangensis]|uniref:Uncharacterized protein n=1 Tax=Deinococcus xinjiangensis TaxID=457454 RepID=A0ABP9VHA8_9DEIO